VQHLQLPDRKLRDIGDAGDPLAFEEGSGLLRIEQWIEQQIGCAATDAWTCRLFPIGSF
jgi:hypothetical protein